MRDQHARAYWKANIKILFTLLSIWFFISFVCGILLADYLDNIRFAGFKLGFWIAQQGSIYVFVILIIVYLFWMDKLDARYQHDRNAGKTDNSNSPEITTRSGTAPFDPSGEPPASSVRQESDQ
jgi:putative solute:sodium symporter small subunit